MANKLGAAFLRCSLGPLNYGGGCLLAGKILDGLNELSADSLHGGLERGIQDAARQAGVRPADVEGLLPMRDIEAAAVRLDRAQKQALAAWRAHAGQIGGLMTGVADLTVDSRAPDVSSFLLRLSKKLVRDPALSEPLTTLSAEVARWLDLVELSADKLADANALEQAYRRRRVLRASAVASAAVVGAALLAVLLWFRAARARIDAALAVVDPCAPALSPADLERASAQQRQRAAELRAACEQERRREEAAREAQRLRDEQARAAELARKAREARCQALAAHLSAGPLSPDDAETAGDAAAMLSRVAARKLLRSDLEVSRLPCDGTPAGAKIADAFAAAVAASPTAWARPDDVSERVHAVLAAQKDALPGSPKQVLAKHADRAARKAIVGRDAAATARAARLCELTEALGIPGGRHCATLKQRSGSD